jgi:hypothetical protein
VKDGVNFRFTSSFDNVCNWRGIRENAEKVNIRKAYATNVENSL